MKNSEKYALYRSCTVFNCDRRRGNVCCADCSYKCKNRCLNTPERCGLVADKEPVRERRHRNGARQNVDGG